MVNDRSVLLAIRARLLSLQVVPTTTDELSCTAEGYGRSFGSFTTDGFLVGMEVVPDGFPETDPVIITDVSPKFIKVDAVLTPTPENPDVHLTVGLPIDRAWENIQIEPKDGRWMIEEEYLPGSHTRITLGKEGAEFDYEPIYVIRLYGIANRGTSSLYTVAEALLRVFPVGTTFEAGDGHTIRVRSDTAPYRSQLMEESASHSMIIITIPLRIRTTNSAAVLGPGGQPPEMFTFTKVRGARAIYDPQLLDQDDFSLVTTVPDNVTGSLSLSSLPEKAYTFRRNQLIGASTFYSDGDKGLVRDNVPLSSFFPSDEFSAYFLVNYTNWPNKSNFLIDWFPVLAEDYESRVQIFLYGSTPTTGVILLRFASGLYNILSPPLALGNWPLIEFHIGADGASIILNGEEEASAPFTDISISRNILGTLGIISHHNGSVYGIEGRFRHALIASVNHTEDERTAIRSAYYEMRGFTP